VHQNVSRVVALGAVPKMVELLTKRNSELQYETGWVLTNVCAGTTEETEVVVRAGAVPILISLLQSPSFDVRVQAAWCLGNIAGDSPRCRDTVVEHGIVDVLLNLYSEEYRNIELIQKADMMPFVRISVWAIANLCRGHRPPPHWTKILPIYPVLCHLLQVQDEETLTDICWGISRIIHGTHDKLKNLVSPELCERLIELIRFPTDMKSLSLCLPALRAITNIVSGDDYTTSMLISVENAFPHLVQLLQHSYTGIRKEVVLTFSNIAAGTIEQVQAVARSGVVEILLHKLTEQGVDYKMKREIVWFFSNLSSLHDIDIAIFLVSQKTIPSLLATLDQHSSDNVILLKSLDVFINLLASGSSRNAANPFLQQFPSSFIASVSKLCAGSQSSELQDRCLSLKNLWDSFSKSSTSSMPLSASINQLDHEMELEHLEDEMRGLNLQPS